MKKIMVLCMVCILLFGSCTQSRVTMRATVLEVQGQSMIVCPLEGSAELKSSDRISLPLGDMLGVEQDLVGEVVEIVYDGYILETYPGQLGHVYTIKVCE